MGDIHIAVQGDWDLSSLSRRNGGHGSAFKCVQRRSSASGMRGYVYNNNNNNNNTDVTGCSGAHEELKNCNNQINNHTWTAGLTLLELIPGLKDNIGSNSLAIDNKIGEAMDLVKSHLMLTVRAEVAVLKEQIKELKEKNSKLEYENSVLKTAASPETLAKLSQP